MVKYFKSLIPFSNSDGIYNPGDLKPGKASDELVNAWIAAGYVLEVEKPTKQEEEAERVVVNEFDAKTATTATEGVIPVEGSIIPTDVPERVNVPETTEKVVYEAMTYPQLKKAAKAAGIKNYNSMKQENLIKALKGE